MTVDENGLEHVARAICAASGNDPDYDYDPNGVYDLPGVNLRWKLYTGQARAAITAYLSTRSAEPVAWEFFQDKSYFGMWCVREVGASRFGDGFHVVSQEEARALRAALSAAAIRKG